jgi:hypothetical protein
MTAPALTPFQKRALTCLRLDIGTVTEGLWCKVCKAYSGFSAPAVRLTPKGVLPFARVTGCFICADDDTPEARHG